MPDLLASFDRFRPKWQREGRQLGFQHGRVTSVDDPQEMGRVKARLFGMQANEESDWLEPLWPGSIEAVPRVDEPVFVGFIQGDPHQGCYAWHPDSTSEGRPTEAMVLGTTLAQKLNYLATFCNNLQTNLNTVVSQLGSHLHAGGTYQVVIAGGSSAGTYSVTLNSGQPTSIFSTSNETAIGDFLAHDSSSPADESAAKVVLSGETKVR
jgi:hypothetical protein